MPRNIKSAMRRDRTRKVKTHDRVAAEEQGARDLERQAQERIQLRKGKKILTRGSISAKTTTLKLKKTTGKLTTALIWTLGKKKLTRHGGRAAREGRKKK